MLPENLPSNLLCKKYFISALLNKIVNLQQVFDSAKYDEVIKNVYYAGNKKKFINGNIIESKGLFGSIRFSYIDFWISLDGKFVFCKLFKNKIIVENLDKEEEFANKANLILSIISNWLNFDESNKITFNQENIKIELILFEIDKTFPINYEKVIRNLLKINGINFKYNYRLTIFKREARIIIKKMRKINFLISNANFDKILDVYNFIFSLFDSSFVPITQTELVKSSEINIEDIMIQI